MHVPDRHTLKIYIGRRGIKLKDYEELRMDIVNFPQEDVVRTSGHLNSNSSDNDGKWDSGWDRE